MVVLFVNKILYFCTICQRFPLLTNPALLSYNIENRQKGVGRCADNLIFDAYKNIASALTGALVFAG